jgi:hypothetical protein
MGFEYAYLYDGLCMGVYEHEEFLAYLADTDYASDAEECDLEAENYYYFEEDYDSTMTFGGYTHAEYEEYGKATLAYYQNMKDLTDLRALAERDIQ